MDGGDRQRRRSPATGSSAARVPAARTSRRSRSRPGRPSRTPGAAASTSYSYRVRAVDAVPNLGPYSTTATATTPAPADTTAADGADQPERDRGELDPGQPLVDGRDRQRRGHRLPGRALPGCGLLDFAEIASRPGRRSRTRAGPRRRATRYRVRAIDAVATSAPTRRPQPRRRRLRRRRSWLAYAFNEGSGTTAADASGSGLTGTLTNGATWGAGRNAGAVSLDGVNDFVELGNPTALAVDGEHDGERVGQLGGVPG